MNDETTSPTTTGPATEAAETPVTEDELREHVGVRLAAFKVPVRIWFSDEPLPRNPAGKILKRDLKARLLGDAETAQA